MEQRIIEAFAALFGIASAWLMKKAHVSCYPVGALSVSASAWICYHSQLYAHMGVNIYYFVVGIYGWYHWSHKQQGKIPFIRYTKWWEKKVGVALFIGVFSVLYYFLKQTDSDVALWDAGTTALYAVGMWWVARKCVENWWMWIAGDTIAIPLYAYKALWFFTGQYVIFLGIAVMGLISWREKARTDVKET